MTSPQRSICFLTDENYVLPTLLASMQARQRTSPDLASVIVFFMHDGSDPEQYRDYFELSAVDFVPVDRRRLENFSMYSARLFLDEFLDQRYTEILYIDADVQVTASLDELVAVDLPEGKFLATRDPFVICQDWEDAPLKDIRAYYSTIGITGQRLENYFNSGVLRASRQTWRDISIAAREELRKRTTPLRFADQDALNLVAQESCLPMSFKWNFPAFFRTFMPAEHFESRIEHFMSNPRPWFGPFPPWGKRAHAPYVALVEKFPELKAKMKVSPLIYTKYALQQEYKGWTERRAWGRPTVLSRIAEIETQAVI